MVGPRSDGVHRGARTWVLDTATSLDDCLSSEEGETK